MSRRKKGDREFPHDNNKIYVILTDVCLGARIVDLSAL